ncbi:MAG: hypothetical protein WAV09_03300 [Minisyncoccia bacterium]
MTMLKGYTIPSPGPGDGEYGGFGGYGDVRFAGFAASPAVRPYWEGQGIANTIPALNGYGEDLMELDPEAAQAQQPAAPAAISPIALVVGALAGRFFIGGLKGIVIGAAAGHMLRRKIVTGRFMGGFGLMMGPQPMPGTNPAPPVEITCVQPELPPGMGATPLAMHSDADTSRSTQQDKTGTFLIAALIGLKLLF